MERGSVDAAVRRRADPVRRRLSADAGPQGRTCSPTSSTGRRRGGLYGYQPDPATERYPLALISPASEKTITSTLGELRERAAVLQMHPTMRRRAASSHDDPVRVFNELGEVHVPGRR